MRPLALIVEDDNSTSLLLQQVVRTSGLEAIHTEDGAAALGILEQMTPQVIILDILLPQVNGIEVLQFIEQTPRLNDSLVIVISSHEPTAYGWETNRANLYYIKPVRVKELREILQTATNQAF
jgi:DNA-binding response OmpR family regulator